MRTGDTTTGSTSQGAGASAGDAEVQYSTFDPTVGEISVDVARAVAEATDRDPATMEPLANAIDPDALDAVVGSGRPSATHWAEVTFEYLECKVTVCSDGVLTLAPRTD
ncbi:HalOD1 output domain-containing protein [Halobaculum litoreum]|uniref:HalOD1 output domain-containing protein n=1 Tax=Halobaculum litoreum TaxID=3031998 RepID=A0ABD5XU43_9EURY|nr:HalOD1 output domain-containing protein [Halobaculum sp. DT92]